MKVKVISCANPYWGYNGRIGEVFEVDELPDNVGDYWCPSEEINLYVADCEVITEETAKPVTQVGDINSNTKGSGARYNNGKPDYSLLVIEDILPVLRDIYSTVEHNKLFSALESLGQFQQTHEPAYLYDILDLLGVEAVEESCHVFTYGANKYKAWNWIKGMQWGVPLACAVRHSLKILNGEEVDEESGRKHTGHIICNIMMLIHYSKHFKEGNELPPKEYFE